MQHTTRCDKQGTMSLDCVDITELPDLSYIHGSHTPISMAYSTQGNKYPKSVLSDATPVLAINNNGSSTTPPPIHSCKQQLDTAHIPSAHFQHSRLHTFHAMEDWPKVFLIVGVVVVSVVILSCTAGEIRRRCFASRAMGQNPV